MTAGRRLAVQTAVRIGKIWPTLYNTSLGMSAIWALGRSFPNWWCLSTFAFQVSVEASPPQPILL